MNSTELLEEINKLIAKHESMKSTFTQLKEEMQKVNRQTIQLNDQYYELELSKLSTFGEIAKFYLNDYNKGISSSSMHKKNLGDFFDNLGLGTVGENPETKQVILTIHYNSNFSDIDKIYNGINKLKDFIEPSSPIDNSLPQIFKNEKVKYIDISQNASKHDTYSLVLDGGDYFVTSASELLYESDSLRNALTYISTNLAYF